MTAQVSWKGHRRALGQSLDERANECIARVERRKIDRVPFAAEGRRLRDTPPWKPYRQVLRDSVVFALERAGLAAQDVDSEGLIAHVSCIPVHPDVPAALVELKKRYRLAAISNTDDDLIVGSLRLRQASGQLQPQDVTAVNALLAPR